MSFVCFVRLNWSAWLWVNQPRVVTWPVWLFREKRPSDTNTNTDYSAGYFWVIVVVVIVK